MDNNIKSADFYIGKVSAVEKHPATVDEFYFWTQPNVILSPFDIVVVERQDNSKTFGVVEEISHITDAESFMASFISNDFGDIDCPINTERIGMNYVRAKVVGNTKNIYTPVHNGDKVAVGTADEISEALGLIKNDSPKSIACGYLEMYKELGVRKIELPVYVNSDFLVGPEGAHLNISGISGLASKTSYAMFLLNAIQQKSISDKAARGTAFIFMNVKGRDLLTIDQSACENELTSDDINMYNVLGLEMSPFKQVHYFYPCKGRDGVGSHVRPGVLQKQMSKGKAKRFAYTYEDDRENIELLFSNIDDPQQTMESIVNYIVSEQAPFNNVSDWRDMMSKIDELCRPGNNKNKEISVMSWRKFKRIIRKAIDNNDMFLNEVDPSRNETRLEDEIKRIKRNDVYVVDIAQQDENMQAFVFGTVMEAVQKLKLGDFDDDLTEEEKLKVPDRIVIFVDELNKYASTDTPKSSPILRRLLEIAERGRSIGIVLFSAEQFKSSIHPRITGNCSMHAYGQTNAIEIATKSYSFVPQTYKNMMTRLSQGHYIIQNPIFRSLLKVRFPRPLYHQDKGETK